MADHAMTRVVVIDGLYAAAAEAFDAHRNLFNRSSRQSPIWVCANTRRQQAGRYADFIAQSAVREA
jgi:hypothetical protein